MTTDVGIAACVVDINVGVAGAPTRCQQLVAMSERDTLVRILVRTHEAFAAMAASGAPEANELRLFVTGRIADSLIVTAMLDALRNPPLGLTVRQLGTTSVSGTASYRVSPVLDPFREQVTVEALLSPVYWLEMPRSGSSTERTVNARVHVVINRQNTSRAEDWRYPDDAQLMQYTTAVRVALRRELAIRCAKPSWKDDFTMECR